MLVRRRPGWQLPERDATPERVFEARRRLVAALGLGLLGAPLRLVLPWKYGFKSAKALIAFAFTAERSGAFWSAHAS